MRQTTIFLILSIFIFACHTDAEKTSDSTNVEMQAELDSIKAELNNLKSQLEQNSVKQNASLADSSDLKEVIVPAKKQSPPPQKPEKLPDTKEKPTVQPISKSNQDSVKYFYSNGKISIIKTPMVEGRAWWLFYDLYGEETCRLQEVHLSYTESVELKFHPNGAASHAYIHSNPGASMYFYESEITFDTNNVPGWKTTRQYPPSLEDAMKPPYYWDKKTKTWKQQETVIE